MRGRNLLDFAWETARNGCTDGHSSSKSPTYRYRPQRVRNARTNTLLSRRRLTGRAWNVDVRARGGKRRAHWTRARRRRARARGVHNQVRIRMNFWHYWSRSDRQASQTKFSYSILVLAVQSRAGGRRAVQTWAL